MTEIYSMVQGHKYWNETISPKHGFIPFIGFVFVDEQYRGKRLSELMIQSATSYAHELGYKKYIL